MIRLFTFHPNNVCFTYYQHFKFSMSLSIESFKAFIHAFFPFLFTSSTYINNIIKNKLLSAGCKNYDTLKLIVNQVIKNNI